MTTVETNQRITGYDPVTVRALLILLREADPGDQVTITQEPTTGHPTDPGGRWILTITRRTDLEDDDHV